MRRSERRRGQNLDYNQYHNFGIKTQKDIIEGSTSEDSIDDLSLQLEDLSLVVMNTLVIDESIIGEEIDDFIQENDVSNLLDDLEEIDVLLSKAEDLRNSYRRKHKELQMHLKNEEYEEKYGDKSIRYLERIKRYIITGKDFRKQLKMKDGEMKKNTDQCTIKKVKFVVAEISQRMTALEGKMKVNDFDLEDDQQIKIRRDNINNCSTEVKSIGQLIKSLMDDASKVQMDVAIDNISERYEKLICLCDCYTKLIQSEVSNREINKKDLFKASTLSIKLEKFKGYDSIKDFYSFKSDFEKLYLKSTPKSMLSDLLRNNFLDYPALSLVKNVDDIDEIWKRLKVAYGDHKTMLAKKLAAINKLDAPWKSKDPEKIIEGLSKITNMMRDLIKLSKTHDIESKLFNSDALDKIFQLIGDNRVTRWLSVSCEADLDGEEMWNHLITFLEKDIKVNQQKLIIQGKSNDIKVGNASYRKGQEGPERTSGRHIPRRYDSHHSEPDHQDSNCCSICEQQDHVATKGPAGRKVIQYFNCKKFAESSTSERFNLLRKKRFCIQCLFPGAYQNSGKHKDGSCQRDFSCKHNSHEKFPAKKHVLVCDEHKHLPENIQLLKEYKSKFVLREGLPDMPSFAKNISIHHAENNKITIYQNEHDRSSMDNKAIYMFQTIKLDGKEFNLFYDSGCGDFISRYQAINQLQSRSSLQHPGPIGLGGVGGINMESPHGIYSVKISASNGSDVILSGVCLDKITSTFPLYPLQGKVEQDIRNGYLQVGGKIKDLPNLPQHVGGDIDFMIGIRYLRYFPEQVFQLPSGLTIYRSYFKNADGSDGVIGGPHEVFTEIEKYHHLSRTDNMFVSNQLQLFNSGYHINPDVSMLGYKTDINQVDIHIESTYQNQQKYHQVKRMKLFEQAELAGSEISYRCSKCRTCKECKSHDFEESVSIKEEIEQEVINESVAVNLDKREAIAKLPFMQNPATKLCPNKNKALKVFQQQLRRLDKHPKDKEDVIKSEQKLQSLGHVDYVKNLPEDVQLMLKNNTIQNFIPWRAVWKDSSLSTPCRIVFDASQATASGFSLNDILAKGRNNMNKLVEVFIRWRMHRYAFHTDIQKMYNSVKLQQSDWCFQRYLWIDNLETDQAAEEKVIKTLIYGVKSSGNQAEYGLRQTASLFKDQNPHIFDIVNKDIYVDDCLSGGPTIDETMECTDQLELILNKGGFTLKGITLTGKDPHDSLSSDGTSISVAGAKWYPKEDFITLDIKELNFAKKFRGKRIAAMTSVPDKLTRRNCVSKVAEIFDMTGILTPLTAAMKLDLHELVKRKLDWDDVIPSNIQDIWHSHFRTMTEIGELRYKRAVVPEDASSLDIETLDFGDASKVMACISIYARFKLKSGGYSCQLIFARSRLIPDGMTQPRAELYAAVVNTHAGEVVKKAFQDHHKNHVKFTDSQIVLHWLSNENRVLKQWVRTRVIEILRFTDSADWKYVKSSDMIADIGTRKGCKLDDVSNTSTWINGFEWMKFDQINFPMKSVDQLCINSEDLKEINTEQIKEIHCLTHFVAPENQLATDEIVKRYQFSQYLIDPNKFRFKTVVRIIAMVIRFVNNLKDANQSTSKDSSKIKISNNIVILSDKEIKESEQYFFKKATLEVKKFLKPSTYQNISKEINSILTYTGRILENNQITVVGNLTSTMKDLTSTTFCVPILDKYSPLSFSLVNEFHWYDPSVKHSGIETTWRNVLKKVYIIEGRSVVKKIRKGCERCRYLRKKTVEVAMGPVSDKNLVIAPAFYITQTDLCGPFKAYSPHNTRTTLKIWLVVFCCNVTSTVNIKVMDDYSTASFIQAFTRFSCEVGYPKIMLTDAGSQLVKACEVMNIKFINMKYQLNQNVGIEFETCPVGGHNMNGKVERKIREVKDSINKTLFHERLSILQWETLASSIANNINNLPLALGNISSDFEAMDLLTPNRLRLGRNNDRNPVEIPFITSNPGKILKSNQKIYEAWFDNWLVTHVPKLIEQPKWFKNDMDLKEGDIVLFVKNESSLSSNYQFGMVESVSAGIDGLIRKATIRYQNWNENTSRTTQRSVRSLVVIHHVDEINIIQELGNMACIADAQMQLNG